jgi:hypothetical protein
VVIVVLKEPCEPTVKRMAPHEFAIDGLTCQNWQVKKTAALTDRPCVFFDITGGAGGK